MQPINEVKPMICHGCQADLSKARNLSLNIIIGRLVVKCPLCDWNQYVKIKDDGTVEEVTE